MSNVDVFAKCQIRTNSAHFFLTTHFPWDDDISEGDITIWKGHDLSKYQNHSVKRENNAVLIHTKLLGKKIKAKERGESTKAKGEGDDEKDKKIREKDTLLPL